MTDQIQTVDSRIKGALADFDTALKDIPGFKAGIVIFDWEESVIKVDGAAPKPKSVIISPEGDAMKTLVTRNLGSLVQDVAFNMTQATITNLIMMINKASNTIEELKKK